MAHFTMQTSAWILTIISIDRYFIIISTYWKQKFSKNFKFNLAVIISIILFFVSINLPVALLNGEENKSYKTEVLRNPGARKVECYKTEFFKLWEKITLVLECILPLILMILFNGLLINKTYKSSVKLTTHEHNKKDENNKLLKSVSMSNNILPTKNYTTDTTDRKNIIKIAGSCCDLGNMESSLFNQASMPDTGSISKLSTALIKKQQFSSANKLDDFDDQNFSRKNIRFKNDCPPQAFKNKSLNTLEVLEQTSHSLPYLAEQKKNEPNDSQHITLNTSKNNFQFNESQSFLNIDKLHVNTELMPSSLLNTIEGISNSNINNSCTNINNNNVIKQNTKIVLNNNFNNTKNIISLMDTKKGHSHLRNRRIVLMLTLLMISFTVSTLPSSMFYTFLRPILSEKPYRRLLSMNFNILRHLSHSFNFVIYFTSSSIIKQQLKETLKEIRKMKVYKFLCVNSCNLFYILILRKPKEKSKIDSKTSNNINTTTNNNNNNNKSNENKSKIIDNQLDDETSSNIQINYSKNKSNASKSAIDHDQGEYQKSPSLTENRKEVYRCSQSSLNVSSSNNNYLLKPEFSSNNNNCNYNNNNSSNNESSNNEEKIDFESISFNVPLKINFKNNNCKFKRKKKWF